MSPDGRDGMGGGARRRTAFPRRPGIGPRDSTPGFSLVTHSLQRAAVPIATELTPARSRSRESRQQTESRQQRNARSVKGSSSPAACYAALTAAGLSPAVLPTPCRLATGPGRLDQHEAIGSDALMQYRSLVVVLWCALSASAAEIVDGPLGRKLDNHMNSLQQAGFSGVLLVAKDGNVVIAKGYGLANRAQATPFTSQTVFDVGSVTKQFTAAAIVKLEMQGTLRVDDTLTKFFTDVPPDKAKITLHQLLTHSSGMKGEFGRDYAPASRQWIIDQALKSDLLFPPGEGYRYSNAGYSLLAAIIEQVAGGYESYLHDKLFLPAGMKQSGYRLAQWEPEAVAHGYRRETDWGLPTGKNWAEDGPYWNLRGNGGILSTVGDLYSWHQGLEGEAILSEAAKEKVFGRHVQEGKSSRGMADGWSLADTPRGTRVVQHNGSNGIFYTDFIRYIDENVVIIAASNRSEDASAGYVDGVVKVVFPE